MTSRVTKSRPFQTPRHMLGDFMVVPGQKIPLLDIAHFCCFGPWVPMRPPMGRVYVWEGRARGARWGLIQAEDGGGWPRPTNRRPRSEIILSAQQCRSPGGTTEARLRGAHKYNDPNGEIRTAPIAKQPLQCHASKLYISPF